MSVATYVTTGEPSVARDSILNPPEGERMQPLRVLSPRLAVCLSRGSRPLISAPFSTRLDISTPRWTMKSARCVHQVQIKCTIDPDNASRREMTRSRNDMDRNSALREQRMMRIDHRLVRKIRRCEDRGSRSSLRSALPRVTRDLINGNRPRQSLINGALWAAAIFRSANLPLRPRALAALTRAPISPGPPAASGGSTIETPDLPNESSRGWKIARGRNFYPSKRARGIADPEKRNLAGDSEAIPRLLLSPGHVIM